MNTKKESGKIKGVLQKYRSLLICSVIIFLTAGFQLSCPPPESLEGIETDINPIFHDGANTDSYHSVKINAVAVDQRTGNFFVGGSFTMIDNVPAVNIAFYDKTTDRFHRLFGKGLKQSNDFFSSSVNALIISGNYLYVGGNFTQTAANVPITGMNNITRYYIGNGSIEDINEGYFEVVSNNGLNGTVHALEVFDNELFVGGSFSNTSLGSTPNLNNIARYSLNCGSNCWSAVHQGFNSTVYALEKGIYGNFAGVVLYIGGEFTQLIGSSLVTNRFTAYRPSDNAVIGLPGFNGTVKTLAYEVNRLRIYAGGSFTKNAANDTDLNRIAYFSGGPSFLPLPENGFNGDVNALAVKEYLVFAGGDFTQTAANTPTAFSRIAAFDSHPDELTWANFASGLNDSVAALAVDDTGSQFKKRLIVGGTFTKNGDNLGESLKRITAFEFVIVPTGGGIKRAILGNNDLLPLGLPNSKSLNGGINATAADASGNVYVGGTFTNTANGATNLNRIARYDPATKTWFPLANGGLNDSVESMIIVGDNMYVGGFFTRTFDGAVTNLNRIARYNLTTNTWFPVGNNGLGGFGTVSAFAVKDNVLYVGGGFTRTFDNAVTNLNYLATYNLTTNTWSPFANNGMNANVNALAIVGDDLYVGGAFTRTFDNFYFLFAFTRFNLTSQTWFGVANSGLNSELKHLTVSGNYVFVNGFFSRTKDNTIILNGLARYDIANNSWTMMAGDTKSRDAAIQTYSMTRVGNDLFVGGFFHGTSNGVAHYFTQFYLQKWNVPAPTSDWCDNANWKLGSVPANNSNAVIPTDAGNINITSADVVLNDFNFNGGNLTIAAGRTLTINGILSLNGGTISGNGTLIVSNCSPEGIIGGDSNIYIQTTLVRCINNSGTFNFPVGTANGYSPITVKGISGAGNISVKANQGAYSGAANGLSANRLSSWWQIENPGGGIINANLFFGYRQTDISGNETTYRAYRISGGMATATNGAANTFSNNVSAENITAFSDWTLAEFAPTAAQISVGGRVANATGQGILKASVSLIKSSGEVLTAQTNAFGYYRFENLEAGETYTISVRHKRFVFNPDTIILTTSENVESADFIASP